MRRSWQRGCWLALGVAVAGCTTVGPDFVPPVTPGLEHGTRQTARFSRERPPGRSDGGRRSATRC